MKWLVFLRMAENCKIRLLAKPNLKDEEFHSLDNSFSAIVIKTL